MRLKRLRGNLGGAVRGTASQVPSAGRGRNELAAPQKETARFLQAALSQTASFRGGGGRPTYAGRCPAECRACERFARSDAAGRIRDGMGTSHGRTSSITASSAG